MTRKARSQIAKIHCLKWLRQELGKITPGTRRPITQAQLAKRIKVSEDLLQLNESGRRPLTEKTAFALAAHTGIHPNWFIRNELEDPLPNVAECQKSLEQKIYATNDYYERHLSQRMLLFRTYLFDRTIATELGWFACYASGFNHRLKEGLEYRLAGFRLHNRSAHPKVKAQAEALIHNDDETVASLVIADAQEVLKVLREKKRKGTTPTPEDKSSSALPVQKKRRPGTTPAEDDRGQS
jgi:transcriptional regulator with XRE-family HTH domain